MQNTVLRSPLPYLLLWCLLWYTPTVQAQQDQADSLVNLVSQSEDEKQNAKWMRDAVWATLWDDGDTAEYYAKQAVYHAELSANDTALSRSLNTLGSVYNVRNESSAALHYYFRSLEIQEQLDLRGNMSNSYNNIGIVYRYLEDYDKALEYYQKSLVLEIELGHDVGTAYHNISLIYLKKKEYRSALTNALLAREAYVAQGDSAELGRSDGALGLCYAALDSNALATKSYLRGVEYNLSFNKERRNGSIYVDLADLYNKRGEHQEALKYALAGKRNIEQYNGAFDWKRNALQALSKAYGGLGRSDSAYFYLAQAKALGDSLLNADKIRDGTEMDLTFSFEKQILADSLSNEQKLMEERLKTEAQRDLNYLFAGIGILLFILAVISFRAYRAKQKANAIIAREKQRSEELLLNILPEETAEELKDTGSSTPKPYEQVTVLFTDFKGFTFLAEQMSAADLVAEIHHCFKAFDEIIARYPIEKIKTIGDAYMCAGGLPKVNPTNATDVLRAALDIRDFMIAYKAEREAQGRPAFEIRIGLHTGPVVAGIVGVKKFAYDLWGNTVNTAARMESSGEVSKVNISGTTYEIIKDQFDCEYRGMIEAKNKGEIAMYFVNGERPR